MIVKLREERIWKFSLTSSEASPKWIASQISHACSSSETILDAIILVAIHWCVRHLIDVWRTFGSPFAAVRVAFWNARFIGIEAGFGEGDGAELSVAEPAHWNTQTINLREGYLALIQGVGDTLALLKQPIIPSILI